MKDILILYKDHSFVNKNESDINKKDIKNAELFLIRTSNNDDVARNYIPVKPSKFLLFDKAIVTYSMMIEALDETWDVTEDDDGESGPFRPMDPVTTETDSITDLINLFSSVIKSTMMNLFTINNEVGWRIGLMVYNFGVMLYRDGKEIYNKVSTNLIDINNYISDGIDCDDSYITVWSHEILKPFRNIYNPDSYKKIDGWEKGFHNYFHFHSNHTWEISTSGWSDNSFIGVVLPLSHTITLCTKNEMINFFQYQDIEATFSIHDGSAYDQLHERITKALSDYTYEGIEDFCYDIEYEVITYIHNYSGSKNLEFLDILSHLDFIINMGNLMFSEFFDYNFIDNYIETMVTIYLTKEKSFHFNNETIIPIRYLLNII